MGEINKVCSKSAFSQARRKLKPEFFKDMNYKWSESFYEESNEYVKRFKDKLIFAVDGTYINLPITEETKEKYFVQTNQYGITCVQSLTSVLYDVLNEIAIDSILGESKSEKHYIFNNHGTFYRKDSIVIYDRNYCDYSIMSYHIKNGVDFIIRAPLVLNVVKDFYESDLEDIIVDLDVPDSQRDFVEKNNLLKSIKVRLVKIFLENGNIEILISSILDPDYTIEDFKYLYKKRWGIETYYDRLKNILEVERFSSEDLNNILQDFYGMVLLSTYESMLCCELNDDFKEESISKGLKYLYKVNKSISYSTIIDHAFDIILNEDKSNDLIEEELLQLFSTGKVAEVPNRHFTRKKLTPSKRLRYSKYRKRF